LENELSSWKSRDELKLKLGKCLSSVEHFHLFEKIFHLFRFSRVSISMDFPQLFTHNCFFVSADLMDRIVIFYFLQLFANYCGLELRSIFNYSSGKFQKPRKLLVKLWKAMIWNDKKLQISIKKALLIISSWNYP
jgi:hypothetical protein